MTVHEPATIPCLSEPACLLEACEHWGAADPGEPPPCPVEDVQVCVTCTFQGEPEFGSLSTVVRWPCKPARRERLSVVPG